MPIIEIHQENAGIRLDHFLTEKMGITRSQIQKLIRQGEITVNEKAVKSGLVLEQHDQIYYPEIKVLPPKKTGKAPILDVIYEDDDLLVINKPAGLLVHEALKDEHRATVVDGLLKQYPKIAHVGDDPSRPGIVHRLDKDVSGLMVVAKTQDAFAHLKKQFQDRTVEKHYLALVYGSLTKDADTITLKISRSKQQGHMVARTGEQEGKEAITQYDVLKRFSTATYVDVQILTGRTHQIRVHFQAIGHPVVGDKLHTVKNIKFREIPLDRLFLHSYKLSFQLPDGTKKDFSAPLPTELESILQTLPTL